ncbi:OpgC family protein [Sulfitobacter sabulilitoris]|uniref:OpgC domain-containing protein n=1 Tax=Sulfitobacter sabulilitoris TaxID=2562655 RepID=A0A5S3Q4P6_9RHOB|nr:OpgC domain-containing protein [Sulfitobacter sabulilitoris]TMM51652.1 OpgC domain-containing protein [Sulfitobacter sabulilitoris]
MTYADPSQMPARTVTALGARSAVRTRDPRLDFFRGIVMFIILIAHTPGNWATLWIPARFGFSDATEVFVFCSGMASAIAFGSVFRDQGLLMGAARVAFRCWQVYWAHVCLFLAIAVTMVALNGSGLFTTDYVGQLNLHPFFNDPMRNLPGLLTLTYVPNYFDILPMYLVVLAMMPLVVACHRVHPLVALALVLAVWAGAQTGRFALPAEPWSSREWFFNPFGWQLVFFTGFALMSGWIPAPPRHRALVLAALATVVVIVPLAYFRIIREVPEIQAWRQANTLLIAKTDFGILRYVHFLALAYVAWIAVGEAGRRILPPQTGGLAARLWRRILAVIMKVGQQSLAVFITSMFTARLLGVALDVLPRGLGAQLLVNAAGAAVLVAVAYGVGWFKSHPWRKHKAAT